MKINATLRKLFFALSISAAMTSCGSAPNKNKAITGDSAAHITTSPAATPPATAQQSETTGETFKDFDWSAVPPSTAEIGAFPYLSAPAGLYIGEKDSYSKSKTGYSTLQEFNMLMMFDGQSFFKAEGKVAKMKFRMVKDNTDFDQYGLITALINIWPPSAQN